MARGGPCSGTFCCRSHFRVLSRSEIQPAPKAPKARNELGARDGVCQENMATPSLQATGMRRADCERVGKSTQRNLLAAALGSSRLEIARRWSRARRGQTVALPRGIFAALGPHAPDMNAPRLADSAGGLPSASARPVLGANHGEDAAPRCAFSATTSHGLRRRKKEACTKLNPQ